MKATDLARVRATLWTAADKRRANSSLSVGQFRAATLGLVFLAYAEDRFDDVSSSSTTFAAYGDDGESAYSPRIDFSYPSERVQVEYDGPIDVNKVADDVVARIHADPEFAAHVADQLGAVDG